MLSRTALLVLALAAVGIAAIAGRDVAGTPASDVAVAAGAARQPPPRAIGSRSGSGSLAREIGAVRLRRAVAPPSGRKREVERGQRPPAGPPERGERRFRPTVPPTGEGRRRRGRSAAGAAATGEFTVFRNTHSGSSGSAAVEPNAANDRNAILTTGNFYARVSGDDGLTFEALDPTADPVYGGFCCDQLAYAVDRGSYSLVFWLLQYWPSTAKDENALRLRVFRGREDLLDGEDNCGAWDLEPQENFDLPKNLWFDFNQISHTSKFLYITTNVRDAAAATKPKDWSNDPRVGGLIFRIALDDLDDGNCEISYRFWYEDGDPYITPVQNAASTMYLATHVGGGAEGDNLRIYSIADSATELEKKDKDVSNFKDVDGACPVPGGLDPCADQHSGRMTGFRSGDTIGWLWMGDNDRDFPFPHVRVAVFETGSLKKIVEHQIWNDEFAWQLPAVGVSAQGHLGVLLWAMGGGRFPRTQGFIRTNPRVWTGIQMNAIEDSESGVLADGWGHYASVRQYGNCPDTFLGATYVTSDKGLQEGHVVWFGRDGDGCVDLAATKVTRTGKAVVTAGATTEVTTSVRNQGSKSAPSSLLGYYLSRDELLDDEDVSFGTTRSISALDIGETDSLKATLVVPKVLLSTEFHVIACADDVERISEVTDTNNCAVSDATFTVQPAAGPRGKVDLQVARLAPQRAPALRARAAFTVEETVRARAGKVAREGSPPVAYSLSPVAGPDDDAIALAASVVGKPRLDGAATTRVTTRRLRLPANVPPGRWYLVGCLRHPPRRGDARAANDCRVAAAPLKVTGRPGTRGPVRKRGRA